MEKKIKDYLHLYLGCEVYDTNPKEEKFRRYILTAKELGYYVHRLHTIKPIIRHLSDITEDEESVLSETEKRHELWDINTRRRMDAFRTTFLLSKQFDLFGLIEVGLAIEKTTLKAVIW